jgi:cell division protein FtsB
MRDIGARIQRHRLERYRSAASPWLHRLRWLGLLVGFWLVYAAFLSEHSLYRIWRLEAQNRRAEADLAAMNREIAELESRLNDPHRRQDLLEHHLREKVGMAREGEIIYRVHADSVQRAR